MNEWELQDLLTVQWINSPLQHQEKYYFLVAWELMFPSWEINNNKKKWNEVSVDFILYDGKSEFLCLELKNEIKNRKELLSAYCQALYRSHLFRTQYESSRMAKAYEACFDKNDSYRVKNITLTNRHFHFPETPEITTILAGVKFPKTTSELITQWGKMSWNEFLLDIRNYAPNKELLRFQNIGDLRNEIIALTI